ncbi:ABC transporter ATP-binding protein [Vibrio cholerae]|nr:ABC transporter ATP-binding protein [Vibrio cholerae]
MQRARRALEEVRLDPNSINRYPHEFSGAVVKALSDRVLVMQKGQVMEQGSAESIFHNPQHEYTKKLIAASFDILEENAA